jgi:hypothetical protein
MIVGELFSWALWLLVPDDGGSIVLPGDYIFPAGSYRIYDPTGGACPQFALFGVPKHFRKPVYVNGPIVPSDTISIKLIAAAYDHGPGFLGGIVGLGTTWTCPRAIGAAIVAAGGGIYV